MKKYLVTIEFRYTAFNKEYDRDDFLSKTVTKGVFNSFDDACKNGNSVLEHLEEIYRLHIFPSGIIAKRERFSKNGGCFGSKKKLISNMAYLTTTFTFYAKITDLDFIDIDTAIDCINEKMKH